MNNGEYGVTRLGRRAGTVSVVQNGLTTRFDCACDHAGDEILRLAAVCNGRYVPLGVMAPDGGALRLCRNYSKNALRELGFSEPGEFRLVLPGETYDGVAAETFAPQPEPVPAPEPMQTRGSEPERPPERQDADFRPITPPAPVTLTEPERAPRGVEAPPRSAGPSIPAEPAPRGKWTPIANPSILFRDNDAELISGEVAGALTCAEDGVTLLAVPILPDAPFPMMPIFCFGDPAVIDGREYVVFKLKNGLLTA
ncbi:MAG: hypothetical protein LBT12_00080 [Oscillospiraceae bacterium]|jgi:hypothetical protein|nr:hypothetical protein [Oscillospiraceae bacterium]